MGFRWCWGVDFLGFFLCFAWMYLSYGAVDSSNDVDMSFDGGWRCGWGCGCDGDGWHGFEIRGFVVHCVPKVIWWFEGLVGVSGWCCKCMES